jgi:catechol 2,3-dioxygenase
MVKVNKVAHVVLSVKDPGASAKFYQDVLGMELVDYRPNTAAFLSFGRQHHDIALFKAPEGAERGEAGLVHIAFQIDGGIDELRQAHRELLEKGVEIHHMTDHTITKSVYFLDPDGNQLEFFCEGFERPEDALAFIRKGTDRNAPLDLSKARVR